jgi:hypothetical protein
MQEAHTQAFGLPGGREVREALERLNQLVESTATRIGDSFENHAARMSNSITNLADSHVGACDQVREAVALGQARTEGAIGTIDSLLVSARQALGLIVPVLCLLALVYYKPDWLKFVVPAAGIAIIASSLIPHDLWAYLRETFECFKPFGDDFTVCGGAQTQSGFFDLGAFSHLIACSTTFGTLGGEGDFKYHVDEVNKNMSRYHGTVSGWNDFGNFVMATMQSALNTILRMFGMKAMTLFRTGFTEVDDWSKRVENLRNEITMQDKNVDFTVIDELTSLIHEGGVLLDSHRWNPPIFSQIARCKSYLDQIAATAGPAIGAGKGRRPEPASLCIYGAPGIGKTTVMDIIAKEILVRSLSPRRLSQLNRVLSKEIWRCNGDKFFNGYCGQFVTMIDDLGQTPAHPGSEFHDWRRLIDMVNSSVYPVNMADVASKGRTFFTSRAVLCTTNVKEIPSQCSAVTYSSDAIIRRLHLPLRLNINPEFRVCGLAEDAPCNFDTAKYRIAMASHSNKEAFYFTYYDYATGQNSGDGRRLSVDEVVDQMVALIKQKGDIYEVGVGEDDYIIDSFARAIARVQSSEIEPFPDPVPYVPLPAVSEDEYEGSLALEDVSLDGTERFYDCLPAWVNDTNRHIYAAVQEANAKVRVRLSGPIDQAVAAAKGAAVTACTYLEWWSKNKFVLAMGILGGVTALTIGFMLAKQVFGLFMSKPVDVSVEPSALKKLSKMPKDTQSVFMKAMSYFRREDFVTIVDEKIVVVKEPPAAAFEAAKARATAQSNAPEPTMRTQVRVKKQTVGANVLVQELHTPASRFDPVFETGGATEQGAGEDITSVVQRFATQGSYIFCVEIGGKLNKLGYLQMVQGQLGVVPYHFMTTMKRLEMKPNDYVVLDRLVGHSTVRFTYAHFMSLPRVSYECRDLTFVKFDVLQMHKDLSAFFCNPNDYAGLKHINVRLETAGFERVGDLRIFRSRSNLGSFLEQLAIDGPTGKSMRFDLIQYDIPTRMGDCGGVLTLESADWTQCRKILGIHVAGFNDGERGCSSIINAELIKDVVARLLVGSAAEQCYYVPGVGEPLVPGSFEHMGLVPVGHSTTNRTALKQTDLFEAWCPCAKREPRLNKAVDPETGLEVPAMSLALKPYSGPVLTYDHDEVSRARHVAASKLMECTRDREVHPRVACHTFETAVVGDPRIPELKSIPRGTSAGFPSVCDPMVSKHRGKYYFFGTKQEYDLQKPECQKLRADVLEILRLAKQGTRATHLYVDFLKDEARKPGKAARLISAAPLAYTIAFRMLFLSFTIAAQKTRLANGMAIGINAYKDFDQLAKRLRSRGLRCVAGDYKSFDSSLQPQILWAAHDIIAEWYGDDEWALARRTLWLEVVSSRHLGGLGSVKSTVYGWSHGLPSGHPATSFINSLCNLVLFSMAWGRIMGAHNSSKFWDYVYLCVYGDDNVLNVSDEVLHLFNQRTIADAMTGLGMTYTIETKAEGEVPESRLLTEVSFLKRTFRFEDSYNEYVGALDLESVLCIPYWVRTDKGAQEIIASNINRMWLELSIHDDATWDFWSGVTAACVKRIVPGFRPDFVFTRSEYLLQVRNDALVWD